MEDSKIIDLFWERDEEAIINTEMKYGAYCHTIHSIYCLSKRMRKNA